MRSIPRALLAGGLGFAVAVLVAACGGSSGLLSANDSATLSSRLSAVAAAISSNRCTKAGKAAQAFDNAVATLSSSINHALADNLKQASAALVQQAQPDCENQQTASIPTTTKPMPTTTTNTVATSTTNTVTNPSTSTSTTGTGTSTGAGTTTSPATTGTSTGSTTTTGQSGGAGLGGSTGTSTAGSGGAPSNGN